MSAQAMALTQPPDPAVASFGTQIQVLSSAPGVAPETFATIEGTGDIDGPNRSLSEIETTSHSTGIPVKTFIPSLFDPGELSVPIKFNPAFPTHSPSSPYGIEYLYNGRIKTKFRLVNPDPGKRTREFWGFFRELGETSPVDGVWEVAAVIRITGLMADVTPDVTLTPSSATPTNAGGAATIAVAVNSDNGTSWLATTGDSWITIQSPTTPQTAAGTVNYTVAAQQAGAAARTGHITVAGKTFTVDQAAGA